MKTKLLILSSVALCAMLSSCASLQSANQVADYNGDGVISNAEYAQFQKQKNIEDRNVYSESVKRENAVNTVRDVRDATGAASSTVNIFRNFGSFYGGGY